ncbi:MAG: Lrp/AsnC family transcriptional regulator [Hyphomicrobiales bacterium]
MTSEDLDEFDCRILSALQRDCRLSIAELAERAGLSPSACHRRVKQLEERGVILGYVAGLDRQKLGFSIEFFVEISLVAQSEEALEKFEQAVQRVPEILECHLMSGTADYLLRVAAKDAPDYERIHRSRIARLPGVSRIQSSLSLRSVKAWAGYPVGSEGRGERPRVSRDSM